MARVFIPPLLRDLSTGRESVEISGESVRQIVAGLEELFPGIRERLCDGDALRGGVAVAVDGRVASLGLLQKVKETSEVHFIPAIGGG